MLSALRPGDERATSLIGVLNMKTIEDIDKGANAEDCPADQLAELPGVGSRALRTLPACDAKRSESGRKSEVRLDRLAEQAIADFRAGRAREL